MRGKYGEFTIKVSKNYNKIVRNVIKFVSKQSDEYFYRSNYSDIIYTFYDNIEQLHSQRETYSLENDYEDRRGYFDSRHDTFIHSSNISMSTCFIKLKTPIYDVVTQTYKINFIDIFKEIPIDKNKCKIVASIYNCIYELNNECVFSIAKNNASDTFPSFMFYYNDTFLDKKDVIYLVKKIINFEYS
jgi:hypothetical protein